jgi:serine/threonine protein kinase
MIVCACPACKRKLSIKDDFAGQRAACPQCKQLFQVPAAPTLAGVAAAPPGETVSLPVAGGDPTFDFLMPPLQKNELGRLGPYRVLKMLGAGGMGMVLLAEDSLLKRSVALKVMRPEYAANLADRQRFLREAQAAAAVEHPHIVSIYQVGVEKSTPFIVMPLLQGESLETRLVRTKTLPIGTAMALGRQIADGLAAAHQKGLIHRDVKPANLWLVPGETGETVKILDFGLVRVLDGDDLHLTKTGTILGTPQYMPPEQASAGTVDHRGDLFSLGVVLYRMLSGELPFKGKTPMMVVNALLNATPRPIAALNPQIPPTLAALVMRLLEKEPARRPVTARAVAEMLEQIGGEQTVVWTERSKPRESLDKPMLRRLTRASRRVGAVLWSLRPWAFARPGRAFAIEGAILAFLLLLLLLPFLSRKQPLVNGRPTPQNQDQLQGKTLASEWIPLFHDEGLSDGEMIGQKGWSVRDNVLVAGGSGQGWLGTRRDFSDFDLELEYRLPPGGNSGVFLYAWNNGAVSGRDFVEVQILDDAAYGDSILATQQNGAIFKRVAPKPRPVAPIGQWNHVRIQTLGKHVRVAFNNVQVVDADVPHERMSGKIGLQMYSTPVEFRNIRVREIGPRP